MKNKVKGQLMALPIDVLAKVNLWLTINDLKPATDIQVRETIFKLKDKSLRVKESDLENTLKFLTEQKLFFKIIDRKNPKIYKVKVNNKVKEIEVTGFGKMILVSKNKSYVTQLFECHTNPAGLTPEINLKLGKLYGFPQKAVEEFARSTDLVNHNSPFPASLSNRFEFHQRYKDCYWESYVRYITRKGFEEEDVQIGIKWADFIRKDFPELAEKYEKEIRKAKYC